MLLSTRTAYLIVQKPRFQSNESGLFFCCIRMLVKEIFTGIKRGHVSVFKTDVR